MEYSAVSTQAAVKQFQASNGLVVDGKVGPNTKGSLMLCTKFITLVSPNPIPPNPIPPNPIPPNPIPPQPSEATTGTGDFVGTSEAVEPTASLLPKNSGAREALPDSGSLSS